MSEQNPVAIADARGRQRTLVIGRWAGAVFGMVQVSAYAGEYPAGTRAIAYGLVLTMAALNGVTHVLHRRLDTERQLQTLALCALVADVLLVSGVVWVYAFDPLSAIFVVLILLPIEGAIQYGLRGAMATWVAVSLLYLVREWLGTQYGDPWEWESVSFRTGFIGIVALIVGRLVQDLVQQREATRHALADAHRADEWRARLVSILAHDVRAPLAAVRSGLALLRGNSERLSTDQRRDIELAALRQTDRALLLARDLLDMARSEAGVLQVQTSDVDLRELAIGTGALVGVSELLVVDMPDGLHVHADRDRLEQMLHNLLHNANRYGAGPFIISGVRAGGGVEITVRDHGPGVARDVDLFAAFTGNGQGGSVGLGIWTVRALTEAHHGTIRHEDARPGAAFTVWLPDGPGTAETSSQQESAAGRTAVDGSPRRS